MPLAESIFFTLVSHSFAMTGDSEIEASMPELDYCPAAFLRLRFARIYM